MENEVIIKLWCQEIDSMAEQMKAKVEELEKRIETERTAQALDRIFSRSHNLLSQGHLYYDPSILHAKEKEVIQRRADGEAVLCSDFGEHERLICVHSGKHHLDEVFCVYMLRSYSAATNIQVLCSCDPEDWDKADLVIDVGEGLLDHHGKRAEEGVSAVTRVFLLLRNTLFSAQHTDSWFKWERWEELALQVECIAAVDLGLISAENTPFAWLDTMLRAGVVYGTDGETLISNAVDRIDLEDRVAYGNFLVKELDGLDEIKDEESSIVDSSVDGAGPVIDEAIKAAGETGIPVFPLEASLGKFKRALWESSNTCPLYVRQETQNEWRVCCAPIKSPLDPVFEPYRHATLIPDKYRGLGGRALSEVTGIQECLFCDASGYKAGFKTKEAAEKFAALCLSFINNKNS